MRIFKKVSRGYQNSPEMRSKEKYDHDKMRRIILLPFVFKISEQLQQDEVKHEQSSADPEDRVNYSG